MTVMMKKLSGEEVEEEVSSGDEKVDSETSYSKGSSLKAAKPTTKRLCPVEFNTICRRQLE